jgi:hypothetical protein
LYAQTAIPESGLAGVFETFTLVDQLHGPDDTCCAFDPVRNGGKRFQTVLNSQFAQGAEVLLVSAQQLFEQQLDPLVILAGQRVEIINVEDVRCAGQWLKGG